MSIHILKTIDAVRSWRKKTGDIAFVPTMGNLHEGHMALVEEAKRQSDTVIVSIFINPLQFGEGEDLDAYPQTMAQDLAKLEQAGVTAVFAPQARDLYPEGKQNYGIKLPDIARELCGKYRPGHFEGVATVVSKLFNIVQPTIACFGEKDFQQLHIIQSLVRELNFPVIIVPVPTVRNVSGLALSSRNSYLSEEERLDAACLHTALKTVATAQCKNIAAYANIIDDEIAKIRGLGWEVDYLELRNAENLLTPTDVHTKFIVMGAIRKNCVRLIDNVQFTR